MFRGLGTNPTKTQTSETWDLCHWRKFSGFVLKSKANMDPKHRDRSPFARIVWKYQKALTDVSKAVISKDVWVSLMPWLFFSGWPESYLRGFIGGYYCYTHHCLIQTVITFTRWKFPLCSISNFCTRLFKRIRLRDPLNKTNWVKGNWFSYQKRGQLQLLSLAKQYFV